jgi:hypothetical protein
MPAYQIVGRLLLCLGLGYLGTFGAYCGLGFVTSHGERLRLRR